MNFKAKLTTGVVTASLFAAAFAPAAAFADTNVVIKDNGKDSFNLAVVKNKKTTKVWQYNGTAVINKVGVLQNTGGNKANGNTGGTVDVDSGNATSNVTNNTTTGGNTANVNPCGCPDGNTTVKITDNGTNSTNIAIVSSSNVSMVGQVNETLVVNAVFVGQNTGGNTASGNTGGDVTIDSGNASSTVNNNTTTGGNTVNPTP